MQANILALSIVDKIIGGAPYMCEGEFAERIHFAHRLGYTGVELNIADPARLQLDRIRQAVAETGVRVVAFGTGRAYVNDGLSLTDDDPAVRDAAEARLRTFLDVAREFGSLVILGCIRGNIARPKQSGVVIQRLREAMLRLEDYASDRAVAMVFEPINRYENNFLCNVADTAAFIRESGLKRTKILMDTFHMNIEDPDFVQTIHAYGRDVAYVHIADSNRKYPGCGHTDFAAVFAALKEEGYTGAYCAECHALDDRDAGCAAWLKAVRALTNL